MLPKLTVRVHPTVTFLQLLVFVKTVKFVFSFARCIYIFTARCYVVAKIMIAL